MPFYPICPKRGKSHESLKRSHPEWIWCTHCGSALPEVIDLTVSPEQPSTTQHIAEFTHTSQYSTTQQQTSALAAALAPPLQIKPARPSMNLSQFAHIVHTAYLHCNSSSNPYQVRTTEYESPPVCTCCSDC